MMTRTELEYFSIFEDTILSFNSECILDFSYLSYTGFFKTHPYLLYTDYIRTIIQLQNITGV